MITTWMESIFISNIVYCVCNTFPNIWKWTAFGDKCTIWTLLQMAGFIGCDSVACCISIQWTKIENKIRNIQCDPLIRWLNLPGLEIPNTNIITFIQNNVCTWFLWWWECSSNCNQGKKSNNRFHIVCLCLLVVNELNDPSELISIQFCCNQFIVN